MVLREGFYDANNVWIPPLEDVRDCPTCDRRKIIFRESVARRFIAVQVVEIDGVDAQRFEAAEEVFVDA